ncbi:MAG: M16 family metallopeptidase [Myxococcaceae bacterium]
MTGAASLFGKPIASHTTPGGMRLSALERGEVPLVSARLLIHVGSSADPKGKEGTADFVARLLRRGTKARSADALDEAIEFVGAGIHAFASEDYLSVSMTTPAEHLKPLLQVLAELVMSPSFPAREFADAKARALAQLAHDLDDPGVLAERALMRAVWGQHPYAFDAGGTHRSLSRLQRADVVGFHRQHFGPETATLHLVGALSPDVLLSTAVSAFAKWRSGTAKPVRAKAVVAPVAGGEVWLVDRPDQTQAQIRIAGSGYARGDSDAVAAQVMSTALGGCFTSRLVQAIRVKRGLSYSASSGFDPMAAGGSFHVSTFTKTETVPEAITVALEEVTALREKGAGDEELARAKRYLAGVFALRTESNDALASAWADLDFHRQDLDWLNTYAERVSATTRADIARATNRFLFPSPPAIVVVGQAKALAGALGRFGRVVQMPARKVA